MAGDSVNQIKERLTIVDVVSPYVELHKAGKNYKGKSPFTNEKTPSFFVSPDRGMYYCFSTSQGGDIFSFVEAMEGVDFKGALKILAEKAGVELVPEDPKKKNERDRQYDVLNEAAAFFESSLTKKAAALDYLHDRGVKPETIQKWRIGYAPGPPDHGWRDGKEYLEGKGFVRNELVKAGLIKGLDTGKEPYDVFRDRVMFPIFDPSGRVVAFSGRILTKDTEAPKYVNSPETELFNKSEILYGYDKAKQGIRTMDFSLIVEGQFDVVMTHQAGYHNAVAVSGTGLTPHHVMLLQRLSNRVVLALDADKAGIAAVKRAAELMLARGMDVKVARMPDGEDPADIIAKDQAEFKKVIGHSTHVIEYLLDVLESQNNDERTFKLKAREEILPYVSRIPNRIDQEHFENIIAERLNTTKDAIHFEVTRLEEKQTTEQKSPVADEQSTAAATQSVSTVQNNDRMIQVIGYLVTMHDLLPEFQSVLQVKINEVAGKEVQELRAESDPKFLSRLAFELEAQLPEEFNKHHKQDLIDKVNELRDLIIKDKLKSARDELRQAEHKNDEAKVSEILAEIAELQKALGMPYFTIELFEK